MKSIKLAFFQYAVFHHSPEENFEYIRQAAEHKRCDLLTLPELFSCGYAFQDKKQLAGFAEQLEQSRTVQFLQQIARNIGGALSLELFRSSDATAKFIIPLFWWIRTV